MSAKLRPQYAVAVGLTLLAAACGADDTGPATAGQPAALASTTTTAPAPTGASLTISSPPSGATVEGNVVTLDVAVDGVDLVKADGDTSGATGHLHFFVDREPTPPGQPIPTEPGIIHTVERSVAIPDLTPGEHTIWVVVGDGSHVPLEPMVADKVTVTVG